MSVEILLVFFVVVSAVAVVLQGLAMWRTSKAVGELAEKLEQRSSVLKENVQELVTRVEGVVESMEPLGRMAQDIEKHVDHIAEMVQQRAEDIDQFGKELADLGRDQASKFDFIVTDTVRKFEETTGLIQKDVLQPAVELSSFFKGLKAGVSYLFNRQTPARPPESYPEDELFI